MVNREYRRGQQVVLKFMTGVSVVEKINKSTGKWMALPLRHQGKGQIVKFNIHPGDGELLHVVLQAGFPKNVKGPLAHVDGSEGK